MASSPQTGLATLQAGRAVAALLVLAVHADLSTGAFIAERPAALAPFLDAGTLGVDFFFVLSGFIIYFVNADVADRPGWSSRYIAARLGRV